MRKTWTCLQRVCIRGEMEELHILRTTKAGSVGSAPRRAKGSGIRDRAGCFPSSMIQRAFQTCRAWVCPGPCLPWETSLLVPQNLLTLSSDVPSAPSLLRVLFCSGSLESPFSLEGPGFLNSTPYIGLSSWKLSRSISGGVPLRYVLVSQLSPNLLGSFLS